MLRAHLKKVRGSAHVFIITVTVHIIQGYAVTKRANMAEVKDTAISAISVFRLALLQKQLEWQVMTG